MRIFNQFEKDLLKKLYRKSDSNLSLVCLFNFFKENIMINRAIKVDKDQRIITIHYHKEIDIIAPREILNFFSLIEYLDSNGLIIKTKNEWKNYDKEFISYNLETTSMKQFTPKKDKWNTNSLIPNFAITFPQGYYDKIKSIYNQDVFISSELNELINNNFKTIEHKTFYQSRLQTKLSSSALGLSLLTLILSWYVLYKSEYKPINFNQSQFNSLVKPLNQINLKMNELNENLILKPDSIHQKKGK